MEHGPLFFWKSTGITRGSCEAGHIEGTASRGGIPTTTREGVVSSFAFDVREPDGEVIEFDRFSLLDE
jgi:hypothetical protein